MTLTPDGYRKRLVEDRITGLLGSAGAVSIEGPRGCGKIDVAATCEDGFSLGCDMVVEKRDADDLRERHPGLDGEIVAGYDVRFTNGSGTVQPGKVMLSILIPDELKGARFDLYHAHGDSVSKLDYAIDGDYAVAEIDEFSDFVLVRNIDSPTFSPMLVLAVIAVAVLLIAGIVLIARG